MTCYHDRYIDTDKGYKCEMCGLEFDSCWLCDEPCETTDYLDDGRVFCSLDCLNDETGGLI